VTALEQCILDLFHPQFFGVPAAAREMRVGERIVSGNDFIALRRAVTEDALRRCTEPIYDCESDEGLRQITAALGDAWNASKLRGDLLLPAWPWA
jgi:hypothetical protein